MRDENKAAMLTIISRAICCTVLACGSSAAQAPWDVRIALVIGNESYLNAPRLGNALNDARAVASALRSLGFTVEQIENGSKADMDAALGKVQKTLHNKQGLAILYYAGHGLQVNWRNYMLPIEIKLTKVAELPRQSVDVESVMKMFQSAETRMNIVILDACRDNPFGNSTAAPKGLAPMDAPPGTLLAYATQPGNVAEDGDEKVGNGPYAQFLTQELRRPFAKVEDVFKRVRYNVRKTTSGRQIPWESTSLEEDYVFNDGSRGQVDSQELDKLASEAKARQIAFADQAQRARQREHVLAVELARQREILADTVRLAEAQRVVDAAKAKALSLEAESKLKEQRRLEENAAANRHAQEWALRETEARAREHALALQRNAAEEQQRLLAQTAIEVQRADASRMREEQALAEQAKLLKQLQGRPVHERREQLFAVEKKDWDNIRDSKQAADVYSYILKHPNGAVSELAQAKLEQLDTPKVIPFADQTGLTQPLEARRFRRGDKYDFVVSDLLTKIVIDRPVYEVISVQPDSVEFNQGYKVTPSGAIIRTIAGATLDPYQQWIPSGEYQVGKRWFTRSMLIPKSGLPQWVELHGRVVSREKVSVPAGTFDTFKMEMEQTAQDGSRLNITYWGEPDWGVAVKQIREVRDNRGALSGQIYELQARKRGS